jgi:AcrR family transcriptional regulator
MIRPRSRTESGGKGARTRTRLIDAAHALFLEKGIAATSMQEIAARAGVTTGAIYGGFAGKDDLVLAVGAAKSIRIEPILTPGEPLRDRLRAIGAAVAANAAAMAGYVGVVLEFRLRALGDGDLRARLAAMAQGRHAGAAQRWFADTPAADLPMPPEQLALALDALITGLMIERALAPTLVTDEVIVRAIGALAG